MGLLQETNANPPIRTIRAGQELRFKGWRPPLGTRIRTGQRIIPAELGSRTAISRKSERVIIVPVVTGGPFDMDFPQEQAEVIFYRPDLSELSLQGDTLDAAVFEVPAELTLVGDPIVRRYSIWQRIGLDVSAVVGTSYLVSLLATTKGGQEIPASWTITPNADTLESSTFAQTSGASITYAFDFTMPLLDPGDTILSAAVSVPTGLELEGDQRVGRRIVYQAVRVDDLTPGGVYLVTCTATTKAGQVIKLRIKLIVTNPDEL